MEWAQMREQPVGQILTASGLWSWSRLDPAARQPDILRPTETWTLVTWVSSAELARVQWQHWGPLWLIAVSALLLLGVGVYLYRLSALPDLRELKGERNQFPTRPTSVNFHSSAFHSMESR